MAGSNQHHVWRLLQRGFGEKRGDDYHIWTYTKSKPPRKTSTKKFGVEKYFYGPEGSLADSNITKYENDNQSAIQDIRNFPHGSKVDSDFSASLIAHLEMRSAFLRKDVSKNMQKGMVNLLENFTDPKDLRNSIIEYLVKNPDELNKKLEQEFIPKEQRPGYTEIFFKIIRKMTDEELISSFQPALKKAEFFIEKFPDLIKSAQNNAFAENKDFSARAKLHANRQYSVWRVQEDSFILPDTTLAFFKKKGASPFIDKGDVIEAVVLPIASNVAIIGKIQTNFDYSLEAVNRVLAGCAYEAFIAKDNKPKFVSLVKRIGKYAKLISDKDLKNIVASATANKPA